MKFGLGIKHFEQGVITSVSDSLLQKCTNLLAGKIRVALHAKIVAIDASISHRVDIEYYTMFNLQLNKNKAGEVYVN